MGDSKKVVVVGGGLSGLCCARTLQRAGVEAHIYEASDGVGGRVRTDIVANCRLDRGFQVLFTAYPAVKQELDLGELNLQYFDAGAIVYWRGEGYILGDPMKQPGQLVETTLSPLISLADKMRVLRLRRDVRRVSLQEIAEFPDMPMEDYLREYGFSDRFINRFIRPFFAGIFLDYGLTTSVRMFGFVWKMLVDGRTAVPEKGMGAIPRQIEKGLAPDTVHLNSPVAELIRAEGRVMGIRMEGGETVEADAVVVATDAGVAARLTGLSLPTDHRSATCLYFLVPKPLNANRSILLFAEPNAHAEGQPIVNNATMLSNVAPSYAGKGKHLLSVTVLGDSRLTNEELTRRAKGEIAPHFPKSDPDEWQLIQIYRIPWAQFRQPTGIFDRLPATETGTPGLFLGGEITVSSSLNGALVSGQRAAAAVLTALGR
ncbi:MAG: UDP-galactopyranose mutase [Chthonomonadaceae bacterium]|nr:UDP-galactopyranose mutase [Chthonomonadaceae bacterium]